MYKKTYASLNTNTGCVHTGQEDTCEKKKINNKVTHVCRKKNELYTFNKVFQYFIVVYDPHLKILLYNL